MRSGFGNNGTDGTEGARTGNVFGSYLHGPILPANPALADALIALAAELATGRPFEPAPAGRRVRRRGAHPSGAPSRQAVREPVAPHRRGCSTSSRYPTTCDRSPAAGEGPSSPATWCSRRDVTLPTARWLNPTLARLAVDLDTRASRPLRVAVPVPARDGSWVVDGWGASRYEPDSTHCRDLAVLVAAGRLLHAHLARAFPARPPLETRRDQWAAAERLAFSAPHQLEAAVAPDDPRHDLLGEVADPVGPQCQRRAGDGARPAGPRRPGRQRPARRPRVPVVIDLSPCWRPAVWAEAVCVLDAVLWLDAAPSALEKWGTGANRESMLRAVAFRVLSDGAGCAVQRYAVALGALAA